MDKEKEAARFLSDISLNFEIADYTGAYQWIKHGVMR
jgi:hypothetical protein